MAAIPALNSSGGGDALQHEILTSAPERNRDILHSWDRTGGLEMLMKAPADYRQVALDCIEMADAARDPAAREAMIHLAKQCAELAPKAAQKSHDNRQAA